jgi:hypothetical protein
MGYGVGFGTSGLRESFKISLTPVAVALLLALPFAAFLCSLDIIVNKKTEWKEEGVAC